MRMNMDEHNVQLKKLDARDYNCMILFLKSTKHVSMLNEVLLNSRNKYSNFYLLLSKILAMARKTQRHKIEKSKK